MGLPSGAPCLLSRKTFSMPVRCRSQCSTVTARSGVDTSRLVTINVGQPDYRMFHRDVGGHPGKADLAEDACHIDYRSATGLDHDADLLACAEEHAVEVHRHDPAPQVIRYVAERVAGGAIPALLHAMSS